MKQRQIYIRSGNSRILLITDNAAIDHRSYILKRLGKDSLRDRKIVHDCPLNCTPVHSRMILWRTAASLP